MLDQTIRPSSSLAPKIMSAQTSTNSAASSRAKSSAVGGQQSAGMRRPEDCRRTQRQQEPQKSLLMPVDWLGKGFFVHQDHPRKATLAAATRCTSSLAGEIPRCRRFLLSQRNANADDERIREHQSTKV